MNTKRLPDSVPGLEQEQRTYTEEQLAALQDTETQRVYEEQHRLQLQRRLCPGCGETDDVPF